MNIVIIGSGNVATHLAQALKNRHSTVSVYSRNMENALSLAKKTGSKATDNINDLPRDADFYIISVKDDAISDIAALLPDTEGTVVHTAGSVPIGILNRFKNHGVFYPFQTFSKDKPLDFKGVPVLIEGNSEETEEKIYDLAKSVTDNVYKITSEQRLLLHISAVFACNFVNYFYNIADTILQKAGLPFDLLLPLIDETAKKIHTNRPVEVQTGPASRNDSETMKKHLDLLMKLNEKKTASLYREISKQILETQNSKKR